MKPPANKELGRGTVIATTTSKQVTIRLRVRPLPAEVTEFLGKNAAAIKRLYSDRQAADKGLQKNGSQDSSDQEDVDDDDLVDNSKVLSLQEFKKQLQATFESVKGQREIWANAVEQITAFGPRRTGANILIDTTRDCICGRLYVILLSKF
jgi:ribosome assembly protein 1